MTTKSRHGSGVKVTVEVGQDKVAELSAALATAMAPEVAPAPASGDRKLVKRSAWSGLLSLGALVFPVKTYTGTEEDKVEFHMFHSADCPNALAQAYSCTECGDEVPKQDTYYMTEAFNGKAVAISTEERESCQVMNEGVLEVLYFTPTDTVDPMYFESTDYIAPGGKKVGEVKAASKGFGLLRLAMIETNTVAIAKRVNRGRDQVVALRPYKNGIVMQHLYFESEIKVLGDKWDAVPTEMDAPIVSAAVALVKAMTEDFDPTVLSDSFTNNLRAMVNEKASDKPVTKHAKKAAPPASGDDFMSVLLASAKSASARRKS